MPPTRSAPWPRPAVRAASEFAYLAVTSKGLDEIAEAPAGQLRFLLNASDMIGGIRGIAIEESDLPVAVTPRETVGLVRQRHLAC